MEEFTVGLCAAGLGCAVLEQLVANGSMKRVMSMLTAALFFGCLLSAASSFTQVVGSLTAWTDSGDEIPTTLNDTVQEQLTTALEEAMRTDAETRLAAWELSVRRVRIYRDTSRTDSIYIERADIVFAKEHHPLPAEAVPSLEKAWGIALEVYYAE